MPFRTIVETTPDCVALVAPDGVLLHINPAGLTSLGAENEGAVLGRNLYEIVAPEFRERFREFNERICRGERGSLEFAVIGLNGARRHLESHAAPLSTGGATVQLAVIRDITERVPAERALRESEQRLRAVTEASPVMIWMSGTDRLCNYFSRSWLDFAGRTMDQEVGNGWAENVHPDDFDRCLQTYVSSFDARRPFQMEYRMRHHSGQYRWILDRGVPRYTPDGAFEGYLGGCLDIQEQKEAYEARFRLAAIVESSDDAIVSKDLNGIVTSWNPAAERIFGYAAQEMIGRSIRTIIPPELQHDEERILATIGRGERIEHFETVRMTKSGERIQVSLTISPVRDENGRITGAAKIARDITQHKKAENMLRTAERLASVGRLAATVAHEINNPLEALINLVYLAKHNAVSPEVREYLLAAEEELDRISHLAKQTLSFYRETKGACPVRVGSFVPGLIAVFAAPARNKAIEICPEIREHPKIDAVPGEIRQVIANLLGNSIDAVDHGRIRIRVCSSKAWDGHGSRGVRVTVADSGSGIAPEVRGKLFEPFFTTKREVGTGLGLYVCKTIVEKHGGSIRVKSSTTRGRSWTAFSVFLPVKPPESSQQDLRQTG